MTAGRAQPQCPCDRAAAAAHLQGADPPQRQKERGPGPRLPKIGDERGHDQQRGGLRRRDDQGQHRHGNGGQAQAHHAFDDTGQDEHGDRHGKQCRRAAGEQVQRVHRRSHWESWAGRGRLKSA
ncbi:hypothetical protein G6F45_014064 [Rhizopus arrhizus]|nr:hypothetical protein G6F45_014064 [Rhizopus arrhizus]